MALTLRDEQDLEEDLNIEDLLAPISDDQPTGEDIRENRAADSLYQKIKDARNTARSQERKFDDDAASSNQTLELWRTVKSVAPEILKTQAKDLEIACWYLEALVRIDGYIGLRKGFELIHQLIELFWDDLYPMPDEDGLETRVLPLAGLNGQGIEGLLIAPIRRATFTEGDTHGPYSFWQYQQALEAHNISDEAEKKKKLDSLDFNLEDIKKAVQASSQEFFVKQYSNLEISIEKFQETGKKLDELCGLEIAPSTSNIINALKQCSGAIKHIGGDEKFPPHVEEESQEGEQGENAETSDNPAQTTATSGPIQTRQQAFKQLKLISDFFLKTEPHSPISYALEKTITWGDMSLAQLIDELIPDGGSRQHYGLLTGIKSNDE